MKIFKRLILSVFIILICSQAFAVENPDYARFEKIFNTLEMETIENAKIKLKDLPSELVVVNFWASWCIPCLHEMPSLIAVSNKFSKKELSVVAINTDEEDQLKKIAKIKKELSFPDSFIIIPDKKFKIADEFKFSAIPVTIIFKKGKAIYFNNGPVDFLKVLPNLLSQ